jgi:Fe2+ or Zn2+ uptake regulation protein
MQQQSATGQALGRLRPAPQALAPRLLQVLEVFRAAPGTPLTANEVYRILLERGTPASLSAVYRTTRRLHEAGLLECAPGKPGFGGGKHRFWLAQA